MKQGIQTDFPHEELRKYGCYFFCLVKWASKIMDKDFTEGEIIALFDAAMEAELVRKNALVFNPSQVLNLIIGKNIFRSTSIVKQPPNRNIYIIYLQKPGYGHFVLFDRGEIYDPLDPERPGAARYVPVSYREIF